MSLPGAMLRDCGECTACCEWMGVPELHKPSHRLCAFCEKGQGCRIHDSRPYSCRNFDCLWRQGLLEEDARPDRIGVVFARQYQDLTGRPTLTLYMRSSTWRDDPVASDIVDRIAEQEPVVIISPAEKLMLVPPAQWQAIHIRARSIDPKVGLSVRKQE